MIAPPALIFVDGIVGSGKSRLAQRLWLHLHKCGVAAEWFAEPESGHKLHELGDLSGLTAMAAAEVAARAWRDFVADRLASPRVTVLDATLLQVGARFLESFDVPQPYWRRALDSVLDIVRPLPAWLIYLHPGDVGSALDRVAAQRGAEWRTYMEDAFADAGGFAGLKTYFADRLDQDLELISGRDLPTLVLTPHDGDWEARYAAACRFLGMPEPEPGDTYPCDIARLAGRYRESVSGVIRVLELSNERLRFQADDQPRLLHVTGTQFAVEGRPIEAGFALTAQGGVRHLTFTGRLADDPLPGTVWHPVAE
jgi:hypothetical protein